eukprot:5643681-Amphidinium_carterae.1
MMQPQSPQVAGQVYGAMQMMLQRHAAYGPYGEEVIVFLHALGVLRAKIRAHAPNFCKIITPEAALSAGPTIDIHYMPGLNGIGHYSAMSNIQPLDNHVDQRMVRTHVSNAISRVCNMHVGGAVTPPKNGTPEASDAGDPHCPAGARHFFDRRPARRRRLAVACYKLATDGAFSDWQDEIVDDSRSDRTHGGDRCLCGALRAVGPLDNVGQHSTVSEEICTVCCTAGMPWRSSQHHTACTRRESVHHELTPGHDIVPLVASGGFNDSIAFRCNLFDQLGNDKSRPGQNAAHFGLYLAAISVLVL